MDKSASTTSNDTARANTLAAFALAVTVLAGALVRFVGLGGRSLWADEFCTWHVSRMPLGASLEWGPELSKPPLYQFVLRLVTSDARPDEWLLRLPAATAGVLTILAAFAIARRAGGRMVGLSAAGLVAFNLLQVSFSQEARPYSFHVLGATVATLLWWRLVREPTKLFAAMYAAVVVLTFHSHYLSLLVFLAHAFWWLSTLRRSGKRASFLAPASLLTAGVLCAPAVVNYLRLRTSMFQGLYWIEPPTWGTAVSVLGELGFGWIWTIGLACAVGVWLLSLSRARRSASFDKPTPAPSFGTRGRHLDDLERSKPGNDAYSRGANEDNVDESPTRAKSGGLCTGRGDVVGLLLLWLLCSWLGLMVLSWVAHPAMLNRYALPAAIPVLLIPVIVGGRIHRSIPLALALVFAAVGLYRWQDERLVFDPGFRELSAYLAETVDPERDLIVLTIDRQTHPDWIDAERLPLLYYPILGAETGELHLHPDEETVMSDVLRDPRQLYLIAFRADPFPILQAAGRTPFPFEIEGQRFSRLLFTPYRLIRVAAKH